MMERSRPEKMNVKRLVARACGLAITLLLFPSCIGFLNALTAADQQSLKSGLSASQVTVLFSNMDTFPIFGQCAKNRGAVAIQDDQSTVDTSTTCGASDTFYTTIDLSSASDGAIVLTLSQEGGGAVSINLTRDADTCASGFGNAPFATASSGGGGDEHMICTSTQLGQVDGTGSYILRDNVDLGGGAIAQLGTLGGGNTFDGNGRTISNGIFPDGGLFSDIAGTVQNLNLDSITINSVGAVEGLMGLLGGGTIDGMTITNSSVTGEAWAAFASIGGLIGKATGGTIQNVDADIDVTNLGVGNVGGLVGLAEAGSTITDVISRGSVVTDDTDTIGGFVGEADNSSFVRSIAYGNVTATNNSGSSKSGAGGFVGFDSNGTSYVDCFAYGDVTATAGADLINKVGGFGGATDFGSAKTYLRSGAYGNVTASGDRVGGFRGVGGSADTHDEVFAKGNVQGRDIVGGILGESDSTIDDAYFVGSVHSTLDNSGGIVGSDMGVTASNCYASAAVTTAGASSNALKGGAITNGYYNSTVSVTTAGSGTGLTASQMTVQSNFSGFNFSGIWIFNSSVSSFPVFDWE